MIDGDIVEGDADKFASEVKTKDITTAIVNLNSYGGSLIDGLRIGLEIKDKKFQTFVGDDWYCVSACADMWLAGSVRYYGGAKSRIGFHGAYWLGTDKSGKPLKNAKPQPDSSGNALVGAYLRDMGLSYEAIETLTTAGPSEAFWLSVDSAKKLGIEVTKWQEPKAASKCGEVGGTCDQRMTPIADSPNANRG
jgi:hypothetical protein